MQIGEPPPSLPLHHPLPICRFRLSPPPPSCPLPCAATNSPPLLSYPRVLHTTSLAHYPRFCSVSPHRTSTFAAVLGSFPTSQSYVLPCFGDAGSKALSFAGELDHSLSVLGRSEVQNLDIVRCVSVDCVADVCTLSNNCGHSERDVNSKTHSEGRRDNHVYLLTSEEVSWVLSDWTAGLVSIENSIIVLQRCRKTKDITHARSVFLHICGNGLSTHKAVENYIVPMFVECGGMSDALLVFNRLACRKEHSWTSLILGYIDHGSVEHAFFLHRQMLRDSVDPSIHTLVALIKACSKLMNPVKGWEIHLEVLHHGFDAHASIGPALIDMYSKCGILTEALDVFEELTHRDAHSWCAILLAYAEHGSHNEALKIFYQMKEAGISPDIVAFVGSLKSCGAVGARDKGRELHMELITKGFDGDLFVGTSLVCMYARCGIAKDARNIFLKLPERDVVSWNALIAGHVDAGDGEEALVCFSEMKAQGVSPDSATYASSLKACGLSRTACKGREIHKEISLTLHEKDPSVANNLIGMYAKCGCLVEAQHVFDHMPVKDVALWTSLIAGYADHGLGQQALDRFEDMQSEGLSPDAVVFACSLKACALIRNIEDGRKKHMQVVVNGCERDRFVGSTLVSMYAKLGSHVEAENAFSKLSAPSVVEWTAIISGYVEYGLYEDALVYFYLMEEDGIAANSVTFVSAATACGFLEAIKEAHEIHMKIMFNGLETDLCTVNSLIAMYGRCGLLTEAKEVFNKLIVKDVVSWNTLITAFAEIGPCPEVLNLFEEMLTQGQSPNSVTYTNILKACGGLGAIDAGHNIHMKVRGDGYEWDSSLCNVLISMYAKCGSLAEAQEVFERLEVRDVVAWTSMIKAYGINHGGEKAIEYFEAMQKENVLPDAVTFSCLLLACSHACLVREGKEYFKLMREEYGVVPVMEHYTSMIDLLARSGNLYEAERFITTFCPALEGSWSALLSGCKTYVEVELGSRCFQELVDINPKTAAWYVLTADVYAAAGRWEDVKWVEELRRHVGAAKKPARALIEVNKKVHEFVVGSIDHGSVEIVKLLNKMSSRLKEEGHLPHLDLILNSRNDAEKDETLCEHAEKLALAFGLLSTAPGVTLRITKNLRMCNDCHDTSKIISQVEKRDIVLRDDCCIHHFKNGLCSCGDAF